MGHDGQLAQFVGHIWRATELTMNGKSPKSRHLLLAVGFAFLLCTLYSTVNVMDKTMYVRVLGSPCKLHKMDPWDISMKKYVRLHGPVLCANRSAIMFMDDSGYLRLNESAVKQYSLDEMVCEYRIVNPENTLETEFGDPVTFAPPVFVPGRVFNVRCYIGNTIVYQFVFTNVAWNAPWDTTERQDQFADEDAQHPSIIYIGMDSISRSEAIRKLQLAMPYLRDELGGYDFEGVLRIGESTRPNMISLLRGVHNLHFELSCSLWKLHLIKDFLWNEAARQRYVTMLVENSVLKHFGRSPVDYFWYAYEMARESNEAIIVDKLGTVTEECYGNLNVFNDQLLYLKRFMMKYKGKRKFAFLFSDSLSHDVMGVERGDTELYELLQFLKDDGHLDNAVLVFGSDHGFRIGGPAMDTYAGRLEQNMPVLVVRLPDALKAEYPWIHANMQHNTKMLISQHDMHVTLKGIINGNYQQQQDTSTCPRVQSGQRLYACRLSSKRSCEEAKIPRQFCACDDGEVEINASLPVVRNLSLQAVDRINTILKPYKDKCLNLTLFNATDARLALKHGNFKNIDNTGVPTDVLSLYTRFRRWWQNKPSKEKEDNVSGKYRLRFYTKPNTGLFEVVVDLDIKDDGTEVVTLTDPMRINRYGNQSHCLDSPFVKQFCLCIGYEV